MPIDGQETIKVIGLRSSTICQNLNLNLWSFGNIAYEQAGTITGDNLTVEIYNEVKPNLEYIYY